MTKLGEQMVIGEAPHELRREEPGFVVDDVRTALRIWRNVHPGGRANCTLKSLGRTRLAETLFGWVKEDELRGHTLDRVLEEALNSLTPGTPVSRQPTTQNITTDHVVRAMLLYYRGDGEGPLDIKMLIPKMMPVNSTGGVGTCLVEGRKRLYGSLAGGVLGAAGDGDVVPCTREHIPKIRDAEEHIYGIWDRWPALELEEAYRRFADGFWAYVVSGVPADRERVIGYIAFFPITHVMFERLIVPGPLDLSDWDPWIGIVQPDAQEQSLKSGELLTMYVDNYCGRHDYKQWARVELGNELITQLRWWLLETKRADRVCAIITTPDGEASFKRRCRTLKRQIASLRSRYGILDLYMRHVPHSFPQGGKDVMRDFYLISTNPKDAHIGKPILGP